MGMNSPEFGVVHPGPTSDLHFGIVFAATGHRTCSSLGNTMARDSEHDKFRLSRFFSLDPLLLT